MMEIETENYYVWYDSETKTVFFKGSFRLNGSEEYQPIADFLNGFIEKDLSKVALNLQELFFLNSSGISMLSKFVINVRNQKNMQLIVIGSHSTPWQTKSLKNLQRLMPSLQLQWME